jgi:copper resistance protein C
MKLFQILLATVIVAMPVLAQAHVHLEKSTPGIDSKGIAPDHIVLEFSAITQLTALSIEKDGEKEAQKLSVPTNPEKMFHLDAPKLVPGMYILKWRAVGEDKHVQSGAIHFTVIAK